MRGKNIGALLLTCGILTGVLSGCGGSAKELKIINMGAKPQINLDTEYYPILDEATAAFTDSKFRVEYVAEGKEMTTLQTKIAGGNYDAVSIGPMSNYRSLAKKDAFYNLNQVIDQSPDLIEKYGGKEALKKLEINGKLCYIPAYREVSPSGVAYRRDLAKKWGIEVKDFASLEQYLYRAKEEFNQPVWITADELGVADRLFRFFTATTGEDAAAALKQCPIGSLQADPYTAVSLFETSEYEKAMEIAVKWYQDGIIDTEIMNNSQDSASMFQEGTLPVYFHGDFKTVKMNFQAQTGNLKDADIGFLPYQAEEGKFYTPNMGNANGIALNAKISEEKAVEFIKFLEAAHTDKTFFDQYQYGKQGISYETFPTDTTVAYGNIPEEKRMYGKLSSGLQDDQFIRMERLPNSSLEETWAAIKANTEENPLNGFVFDTEPVQKELMAVNDALNATTAIRCGITDGADAKDILKDLVAVLNKSGMDKVLAEMNKQLVAYKDMYAK